MTFHSSQHEGPPRAALFFTKNRILVRAISPVVYAIFIFAWVLVNSDSDLIPQALRHPQKWIVFLACLAFSVIVQIFFFYPVFWISDKLSRRSNIWLIISSLIVPVAYSFSSGWVIWGEVPKNFVELTTIKVVSNVLLIVWAGTIWVITRKKEDL